MKKLINDPKDYVDQALEGLTLAHASTFALSTANRRVVVRARPKRAGTVGVVTGGGFGHLPLFAGYVGGGLLDSCAVGDVFAGPSMDSVGEALAAADHGAGVLAVIGNYGGDRMAFEMAAEMHRAGSGGAVETVIGNDDIASAPPAEAEKRRGVAGIVFAFKAAGAAAEKGWPLDRVKAVAQRAVDQSRTIGVALSSCSLPGRDTPTFELPGDAVEMGMGIHGEKGVWRGPLKPVDVLVDEMFDRLTAELPLERGTRLAVLCNSLGATPLEELLIAYRRLAKRIADKGAVIARPLVGPYVTSMEMAGASISVLKLDPELEELVAAPAQSPFWPAV